MTTPAEPAASQPNHGPLASVYTGPMPSGLTERVDVLVNNVGGLCSPWGSNTQFGL
jgi:hypothetical protein